jgi:mRNA interferase RelE/StbE
LAYEITYARGVLKQLRKLDSVTARRILDYMDVVGALDNPRSRGKGLTGELQGIWRYRVGNYRVLCQIDDVKLSVHVVDADHRSRIYE